MLTVEYPDYLPVMQYAESRPLRERMYRAYVTRASEFGKPEWDNSALITEIVQLRQELARLLGYANYAEFSLEFKMAESPRQVLDFLNELAAANSATTGSKPGTWPTPRRSCAWRAMPIPTWK